MSDVTLVQCCRCQAKVAKKSLKRGLCPDCIQKEAQQQQQQQQQKAHKAIGTLLERDDVLILDTETTSMGKAAEVIEVAVINTRGETLLDTLVKPKQMAMNPYAQRVHGISLDMLQDAPSWPEVMPDLSQLAQQRTILAWNAPFDASMLEQSSQQWGLHHPIWLFVCAMRLYAKKRGIKNRGLHKAVVDENLTFLLDQHKSHRALGDVKFVLEVLRATSKR